MPKTSEKEIKYNIIEHIADLSEPDKSGWIKQVNVMSWGKYTSPVIDIRKWKYDDEGNVLVGKGVTLTLDELQSIQKLNIKNLKRYFPEEENE